MTFDKAVDHIIALEGGYVNDPQDPGGETRYGISKRSYPNVDIKSLTIDQAKAIYKRDYWDKCRCDELPGRIAFYVFDAAINQGPRTAIKLLQQVLNVADDGIIGAKTIAAAKSANNETPARYMTARAMHYMRLDQFSRYGKGWLKRIFLVAEFN